MRTASTADSNDGHRVMTTRLYSGEYDRASSIKLSAPAFGNCRSTNNSRTDPLRKWAEAEAASPASSTRTPKRFSALANRARVALSSSATSATGPFIAEPFGDRTSVRSCKTWGVSRLQDKVRPAYYGTSSRGRRPAPVPRGKATRGPRRPLRRSPPRIEQPVDAASLPSICRVGATLRCTAQLRRCAKSLSTAAPRARHAAGYPADPVDAELAIPRCVANHRVPGSQRHPD